MYLSTNGLGLNTDWLDYLKDYPKGILTISLDAGGPEDHRAERIAVNSAVPDAYDHVLSIKQDLLRTPRVVITQTIAACQGRGCRCEPRAPHGPRILAI